MRSDKIITVLGSSLWCRDADATEKIYDVIGKGRAVKEHAAPV